MAADPPGGGDERPGDEPRSPTRCSSGSTTSREVLRDPLFVESRHATPPGSRCLALVFGYPIPLVLAVLMSEVRAVEGPLQRPRIPAGGDAAGRRGAALEGLLRRRAQRACSTPSSGWLGVGPLPVAPVSGDGHAVAGPRGDLGRSRRHRDHLPRGADVASRPTCTTRPRSTAHRIWQKVRHVTLPQLRGVLLVTLILQIIGTSQLFLEPFLFTGGGPANATTTMLLLDLQVRVPEQHGRRLRRGDRAQPDAGRCSSRSSSLVYLRLTRSWSQG